MSRSRARTTWGAIALATGLTAPYLGIFVQSVRAAVDPASVPAELVRDLAMFGTATEGSEVTIAFSYLAAVVGAVTLLVLLLIGGLMMRRPAAREAGFAVFGAMALIAGLATLGGLLGEGPSGGSWLGAATCLACAAIVILLARQATSVDFELAEKARQSRESTGAGESSARGH